MVGHEARGQPLANHPELYAIVRAPQTFGIDETSLGLNEGAVSVTITNTGRSSVPVGVVGVAFTTWRGDVELPCISQTPDRANDADALAPGESFTATVNLGCWTPIAGNYVSRVFVQLDASDGGGKTRGDFAGEIGFAVLDPSDRAAREAPSHRGLFALAGGALRTPPIGELEPAERGYHVTIVFVNAGPRPLALPPVRASLRVYALGSTTPCAGESMVRSLPPLASGAIQVVHLPVTCVRDRQGDYDVVVHVLFEGEGEASGFDVGHVNVRVTRDLDVIMPLK
ncbi:MAG: hypothetical protein ACLQVI_30700 [Polyangiaceae bacterium]|jgi:hypothetical protein